ncbi:iron-sulfur cluster insertion protein ErpA [Mesosutterella sp. OilRF-GAM-744-9]|uniref:Putative iron-sulfur cluster insertion protein ErpA n=2 Tax=Mesosutterella TaxID=2494213 RepID=A0ABS9MRG6_9BURK|nr:MULTISPECIES: iron-sulfur cluster insertion protein ErpA [unclassified Mesosutterella]MCG5031227.1 iron-sulfur cluster insertion protein ErpA [Mesosutterella sp. oilRF-744-WT-GAM-9]MCI6529767.1 iron-sulfur cluster insertion protein ErpA [Mesosutterella sp.]MDL2058673.1 iron-sulfur cluster insertion protein ErpA [Mesosutterella sp. AGMB02718]
MTAEKKAETVPEFGTLPDPIQFSDAAVQAVKGLLEDEKKRNPGINLMLRIFVQGGGCAGFQYGFEFVEKAEDDDTRIEKDGVTFLVDSMSYQYLVGASVDFKDDLDGKQFVIKNPNATTTCGCGSSFSV